MRLGGGNAHIWSGLYLPGRARPLLLPPEIYDLFDVSAALAETGSCIRAQVRSERTHGGDLGGSGGDGGDTRATTPPTTTSSLDQEEAGFVPSGWD